MHDDCLRVIHHSPAGLAHTQTQVNVLRAIKNSLVQEPYLSQGCPTNDLTSADHIIDLSHAVMIPVGHLHCSGDSPGAGEGKASSELVAQGGKKPTRKLEPTFEIDKLGATQADIRVRIHIDEQLGKNGRPYK